MTVFAPSEKSSFDDFQKTPQKGIAKLQYLFLRLFCLIPVSIDYIMLHEKSTQSSEWIRCI